MYAFEYGNEMVMLELKNQNRQNKLLIYNVNGSLILSYMQNGNEIFISNNKIIHIDKLISVEYSMKYKKIVVLAEKNKKERKLSILDERGNLITNIPEPRNYSFYYCKNIGNSIIVVCQGNSNETRDKYGRNNWNFRVDLNNYYVEKMSITQ